MSIRSSYISGEDIITITSEDCTGRKTMKFKASAADEREVARIMARIVDKYQMNIFVKHYSKEQDKLKWLEEDEVFKW